MTDFSLLERLPRFTLLHGPRTMAHAFASELCERLGPTHIIYLDLDTPIIDATTSLFYDNDVLIHDLSNPIECMKYLPYSKNVTVNDWINSQKNHMREIFGDDILGRIFLSNYLANNYEDLAPKVIIRDLDHASDAAPLLARYGRDMCCINLGPLTNNFALPGGRVYWIAVSETKKQVDQFLLDLKSERAT